MRDTRTLQIFRLIGTKAERLRRWICEDTQQEISHVHRLQQSMATVCGRYCVYYVMKRYRGGGGTVQDIVKESNSRQKERNERLIVTKMMNKTIFDIK